MTLFKGGSMGRKTTITKEMILQAAYEILESEGYDKVNIKTVAAKVNCSTQPVSWHFGNMESFRRELFGYCGAKMWGNIEAMKEGKDAAHAFFETGKNYISIACDHPNVFRFLHIDDPSDLLEPGVNLMDMLGDPGIVKQMAEETGKPVSEITDAIRDTIIYTHGLAVFMMWESTRLHKEQAFDMIFTQGKKRFADIGIDIGER